MRWLLVALLALPTASALDALPSGSSLGVHEARLLVRLPEGGSLRVAADPPLDVAVAPPGGEPGGFVRTPAEFVVVPGSPESSWHGLTGTVEVVARRDDASRAARIEMDDGEAGVAYDWAAQKETPGLGVLAALAIVSLAAPTIRRRAGAPRRERA